MPPGEFSRRWSTMRGPCPGVYRPKEAPHRWRASFPLGCGWVYLGMYASEWEAVIASEQARGLTLAEKRRLQQQRTAQARRELLAKLVRAGNGP